MLKKCTFKKYAFPLLLLSVFITNFTFAQAHKKSAQAAKGSAKGTLAPDMDCLVTINGSTKPVSVKAYSPIDVAINVGDNKIEATTVDKTATFKTTVKGKSGEKVIIEISFFDDGKFLDYIKQGNLAMIETATNKNPGLVKNEGDVFTTAPLEVAIINSQPDIVKYLLDKGASFTSPENIFPLHKAVLHASSVKSKTAKDKTAPAPDRILVDLFMNIGCKITDKDDGGNTPLHCAVRAGKLDLVTFFIEKGANMNAKNDFGDTPLSMAEDRGAVSILDYLKSKDSAGK